MGSPFASLIVSDQIHMPGDPGHWFKVRKLTGRQHEEAQTAHRAGFVADNKWAGFFRVAAVAGPTSEEVQRILADPLTGYDRHALVRLGLSAWSYEPAIARDEKGLSEAAAKAIDDLDDDALDLMAREVLKLAKPGLFEVVADGGKAAQVKG